MVINVGNFVSSPKNTNLICLEYGFGGSECCIVNDATIQMKITEFGHFRCISEYVHCTPPIGAGIKIVHIIIWFTDDEHWSN